MKKLLTIIAAMIMCNAYGATETVYWVTDSSSDNGYTSNTCASGDNIAKPADPEKEGGFRFIGWREATDLRDLALLDGTSRTPTSADGGTSWMTTFSYGTVSGTIRCSNTPSTGYGTTGNPSTTNGKYCWCKLTDAGPLSGLINVSSSAWVFAQAPSSADYCALNCSYYCGYYLQNFKKFRRAVFGVN